MKKSKFTEPNRLSKNTLIAKLAEVRAAAQDMLVKRALKDAEDKLSVGSPIASRDVSYIDTEILGLLKEFMKISTEGVLTQRYIQRIVRLVDERNAIA